MNIFQSKLNNKKGATILLALLFLFVTVMVGTLMLSASLTSVEQVKANKEEQQAYLTVSSAAQLVADILEDEQNNYELTIKTLDESVDKDKVKSSNEGTTLNTDGIFSSFINEGIEKLDGTALNTKYEKKFTMDVAVPDNSTNLDTVNCTFIMEKSSVSKDSDKYLYTISVVLEDENKYKCTVSAYGTKSDPTVESETDVQTTYKTEYKYEKVSDGTGNWNAVYTYKGKEQGNYLPGKYTETNAGNYNAQYEYSSTSGGSYNPKTYTTASDADKNYVFEYTGSGSNYNPAEYVEVAGGNYDPTYYDTGDASGEYEPIGYEQKTGGDFLFHENEYVPYGNLKNYNKYYYVLLDAAGSGAYEKTWSYDPVGSGKGDYEMAYFMEVESGKGNYNIKNNIATKSTTKSSSNTITGGNYVRVTESSVEISEAWFDDYNYISSSYAYEWDELDESLKKSFKVIHDRLVVKGTSVITAYVKKDGGDYNISYKYETKDSGKYFRISEETKEAIESKINNGQYTEDSGYYYIDCSDISEIKNSTLNVVENNRYKFNNGQKEFQWNKKGEYIKVPNTVKDNFEEDYEFIEVTAGTGKYSPYYEYRKNGDGDYTATGYKKVNTGEVARFKVDLNGFKAVEKGKGTYKAKPGTTYTYNVGKGTETPRAVAKGTGTYAGYGLTVDADTTYYQASKNSYVLYVGEGKGSLIRRYVPVAEGTGKFAGYDFYETAEGKGDYVISGYTEATGEGEYKREQYAAEVDSSVKYNLSTTTIDWNNVTITKGGVS